MDKDHQGLIPRLRKQFVAQGWDKGGYVEKKDIESEKKGDLYFAAHTSQYCFTFSTFNK